MFPARVRDHEAAGLSLLITQFRNRPRIAAWLSSYVKQVQLLEDAIYDVMIKRMIDVAVGVQLDMIGKIVGEFRLDRADDLYRKFLYARVRINRSQGTIIDVLDVLAILTTTPIFFREYQPATTFIELLQIPDIDPVLLFRSLKDTRAGGTKLILISPTSNTLVARGRNSFSGSVHSFAAGDGRRTRRGKVASLIGGNLVQAGIEFTAQLVGMDVKILGAAHPENNGTFPISALVDSTHLAITNPAAIVPDPNNGSIHWVIADRSYGLLSDVVTVRDPLALPPRPRPGPPTIRSVSPSSGFEGDTTTVTVDGTNLENILSVHVGDADGPTNVLDLVSSTSESMTFKIPPWDGTGSRDKTLFITSVRGTGTKVGAFLYTPARVIRIDSLTPASGPYTGGTPVVILGQGFSSPDATRVDLVLITDVNPMESFAVISDTEIHAVTPPGTRFAPYGVRVTTPDGVANFHIADVEHPAWIYETVHFGTEYEAIRLDPDHGSMAGGYTVTAIVEGAYSGGPPEWDALVIGTLAPMPSIDGGGFSYLQQDHLLWYFDGASPDQALAFRFDDYVVTSIFPDEISHVGGATITLKGTSLDTTAALLVDGASTAFTIVDAETVTFVAPAHAAGTVVVHLDSTVDLGFGALSTETSLSFG